MQSFRRNLEILSAHTIEPATLPDAQNTCKLYDVFECLRQLGLEGRSLEQIKSQLNAITDTVKLIGEARSFFSLSTCSSRMFGACDTFYPVTSC